LFREITISAADGEVYAPGGASLALEQAIFKLSRAQE
jgi:hypothetical protein